MCQGLKCRFQCLQLVGQRIQARVEKVMEGVGRRGDNAGPWAAGWWCSGKVMAWSVPSKLGWRLNAVGCAWAQAPKQVLCVLEMQKVIEKEEASFCRSHSFKGWLWEVLAALGALSLGLGWKRCSQLRYLLGKVVSQVLNPVGAKPKESPKARGERGESSTSYLWR